MLLGSNQMKPKVTLHCKIFENHENEDTVMAIPNEIDNEIKI